MFSSLLWVDGSRLHTIPNGIYCGMNISLQFILLTIFLYHELPMAIFQVKDSESLNFVFEWLLSNKRRFEESIPSQDVSASSII